MVRSSVRIGRLMLPLLLAASSGLAAAKPVQTVILVRHAERAGGMGDEVGISDAGKCRAEGLARILADAGITHIYVSEVARTRQTAEPIAHKLNITPETVPAKDTKGLLAKLATGGTALVVGHSNTVPEIIKALGGGTVPPIADTEFDRLFVVTRSDATHASVVTLHYPGCAP